MEAGSMQGKRLSCAYVDKNSKMVRLYLI